MAGESIPLKRPKVKVGLPDDTGWDWGPFGFYCVRLGETLRYHTLDDALWAARRCARMHEAEWKAWAADA